MTDGPYDIGDGLVATATFDVAGVPTDPTTVVAQVRKPDAAVATYTYSPAGGQPDPHVVRTGAGVFALTVVADAAGTWVVHWIATGAVTAAVTQTFVVSPAAIAGFGLSSYTGDPANVATDAVRLHLGDTVAPFMFSDNEVAWFLDKAGGVELTAAAAAAKAAAARFAGLVDRSVGDVRESLSQRAKQYAELARDLAARVVVALATSAAPIPWAGGMSAAENEAFAGDGDLVQPYFYEGMDSRQGTDDRARGSW